ncbi:MAG: high frequency lysogenization protein HflD [Gammaproteobacteria bacterium]|nr:high frequency lysogenization protein HflD [Gammaproteobacteria bacterium]MDH5777529.1 high frequency lysogenization protein HflD [Gammaproteobacteria bacterium]
MSENLHDKTLALAGVFQAASLVQQIGQTGVADMHDTETCLQSLLELNPESVAAIFGQTSNIRSGLQMLTGQLDSHKDEMDMDITRYVISLLHLERKLSKRPEMLDIIASGIEEAKKQLDYFPVSHDVLLAKFADIYARTISTISPQIMVTGEEVYLSNQDHANKIRALLLCGMRAAILWRQLGGSRWQIIFSRNKFIKEAQRILAEEINTTLN